jgi:hypothetical protein
MGDPYFEPDYQFYKDIPKPKQLGMKRGGKMDNVVEAGEIAAYYGDLMVFGASSGKFTRNYAPTGKFVREFGIKPIQPFGVNYFLPTGLTCHNGAQMYNYIQTIPKGDALGKNVQRAMASVGLPPLKGLAPGAVEDMKEIADVRGITKAFLGSLYPVCEKQTLFVGTPDGKLKNSDNKDIITDPKSVEMINNKPYQTRWVQSRKPNGEPITLTKEEFDAIPKSLKFDGTPVYPKENFTDSNIPSRGIILAVTIPLLVLTTMKILQN